MADTVFANGMAVLHKGSSGKSMGAMPDVCLCPPPAPTGPVPTPLPNNSLASDLDGCATSVLIDGNPAATVDSFITTSTGNEVSKPTGGGVASHATKGKTYFIMGSMDVLYDGKGALRHLDTGTHNHGSEPGNTPPWPTVATAMFANDGICAGQPEQCKLLPYKPNKCPEGMTPHHVIPAHCFLKTNEEAADLLEKFADVDDELDTRTLNEKGRKLNRTRRGATVFVEESDRKIKTATVTPTDVEGTCRGQCQNYRSKDAPCICVSGQLATELDHGRVHRRMDLMEAMAAQKGGWTYDEAAEAGAKSVTRVVPGCTADCIKAQLDAYHVNEAGIDRGAPLRADTGGEEMQEKAQRANRMIERMIETAKTKSKSY